MTVTCLVKMTAVFFQSIGKSVHAVVASLFRDIVCFTPLVLILSSVLENNQAGNGINGILYAAPIADGVSIIVIIILTSLFFKELKNHKVADPKENAVINESKKGLIITISREHGSRGKQIGKMVAEKLNIPFYYKEMIALAAQESGLSEEFISDINTKAPNILYDLYLSTDVVKQAVIAQEKIIRKIADNGTCVIVGRASDYILRDYENVINIFIYGPKKFRIKNIMEMYGDDLATATDNVSKSDYARASYYRNISGKKWGDPHNYSLSLDSSKGIELCVDQICDLYKELEK